MSICLERFDQLNDVLVVHFLKQNDLSSDTFLPINVLKLGLVVDLDSVLFVVLPTHGLSDDCIGALTYLLPKFIVVYSVFTPRGVLLIRLRTNLLVDDLRNLKV